MSSTLLLETDISPPPTTFSASFMTVSSPLAMASGGISICTSSTWILMPAFAITANTALMVSGSALILYSNASTSTLSTSDSTAAMSKSGGGVNTNDTSPAASARPRRRALLPQHTSPLASRHMNPSLAQRVSVGLTLPSTASGTVVLSCAAGLLYAIVTSTGIVGELVGTAVGDALGLLVGAALGAWLGALVG